MEGTYVEGTDTRIGSKRTTVPVRSFVLLLGASSLRLAKLDTRVPLSPAEAPGDGAGEGEAPAGPGCPVRLDVTTVG